ncbi:hypothetical protein B6U99_05830 [Candidatus Geothermarchaeota archaeon ex4572_27]|nr:MAG: hypothetical protein B6U99_05830 [Candidatus Geothermarchaeota archaeon ex4572_27]
MSAEPLRASTAEVNLGLAVEENDLELLNRLTPRLRRAPLGVADGVVAPKEALRRSGSRLGAGLG